MVVSLPGHISFLCLYLVYVLRFVLVVGCVRCQSWSYFHIWTNHVFHWSGSMGMLLFFSILIQKNRFNPVYQTKKIPREVALKTWP